MGLFSSGIMVFGLVWATIGLTAVAALIVMHVRDRLRARVMPLEALFTERELEFNKKKLQDAIVRNSEALYTYRNDESHRVFADYVRQVLNLEVLVLSDGKFESAEAYAHQRGRIEGLRNVLNGRESFIRAKEELRKSEGKDLGAQEAKRSYIRDPATHAGLSI